MEWAVDGEDVLIQCRASFKGQQGTIFVTNKRLAWYQSSARAPQISLPFSFIKGPPRRNKPGTDQYLLKVVPSTPVKEQTEFNFVFTSPNKATDRDSVHELVLKLQNGSSTTTTATTATSSTPTTQQVEEKRTRETVGQRAIREAEELMGAGEARRRATTLASDPALQGLFEELVMGGVITEEEFWESRKSELERSKAMVESQIEGAPKVLVGDIRPSLVRQGEYHYRLTAAAIRQIFAENPAVRRAYDDNVPHKRTEEEFWKEYLQSRYVESASSKPKHAVVGDIFAQAEADLENERKKKVVRVDADLDVRGGEGEVDAVCDDAEEPALLLPHNLAANVESVIARLNEHSALVLEHALNERINDLTITDLVQDPSVIAERLVNPALQQQQQEIKHVDMLLEEDDVEPMDIEVSEAWLESLKGPFQPMDSKSFWTQGNMSLLKAVPPPPPAAPIPDVVLAEAAPTWNRAQELLRHYWSCFPLRSTKHVQKAKRMRDALSQLQVKDGPLGNTIRGPIEAALSHAKRTLM